MTQAMSFIHRVSLRVRAVKQTLLPASALSSVPAFLDDMCAFTAFRVWMFKQSRKMVLLTVVGSSPWPLRLELKIKIG